MVLVYTYTHVNTFGISMVSGWKDKIQASTHVQLEYLVMQYVCVKSPFNVS